ncbi:DUF6326 family protein [Flavobacterium degerlachei]|jgi:hypothetical protein|nr:DUF6326 family protein [Flavobacterium degerlachei]
MKNKKMDKKMLLSTLWIFVTLNYLYCDIMGLMDVTLLKQYLTGNVGGMAINENFLLGAAIFIEIPIIMVLLSRILRNKVNSYANIIAGTIMTLVQTSTLLVGSPTKYYVFCSTIEIAATLFIIWYAWKWKNLKEPNK